MKEFIDKLNEKLTHLLNNFGEHCEEWGSDKEGDCHRKSCSDCVLTHAIEIANELAEEYGKKNTYGITLEGCDDCTIFTMDLTMQEYEFLVSVSELANKTSFYGCMPRMYVGAEGE